MSIETPRISYLPGIQALRGIAAVMVIFMHTYSMEQKYSPDQWLGAWTYYGGLGVDIFFVISGFIMVHVTRNYTPGPRTSLIFLLRRSARLYPLYWVVSLALLALYALRPEMVFSGIDRAPNLLKSFTLWPDYRPPLLAIGWTLTFEMMFYVIFAFALLLAPKRLGLFLAVWAIFIIAAQIPPVRNLLGREPLIALLTSVMCLEFILGAALALWLPRMAVTTGQAWVLIVFGAVAGLLSAGVLSVQGDYILDNYVLRVALFAGPAGLIVFGIAALDMNKRRVSKILQALGDWSYSIYLTHILTLAILAKAWQLFAVPGRLDNVVMVAVLIISSISVGALTHILIEKPIMRAAKAALPGR